MKLQQAFDVIRGDVVAFIGAGGKTSTLVTLGYELAESGWRVLATTTTYLDQGQLSLLPYAMHYGQGSEAISQALTEHNFVFLYDRIENGRVYGPDENWTPKLLDNVDSDILLVEADGADGLPLKVPFEHEPIIPPETSLVIPIASLSVVGKPLDEDHVYNPQAMIDKYGYHPGSNVRIPWVAQVLRDEDLGLRGVPQKARVVAFLNQTPQRGYVRSRARLIARMALKSKNLYGVALGSIRAPEPIYEIHRPVGAVVLAGGASSRMGQPKVLMPWIDGKTIIEHIVIQLHRARVDPVVVVTGHYADEVKAIVKPLGVKVAFNRSHKTGEMLSSLKTGLRAMPDHVAASLIVLGDQPRLQPRVIYRVLKAYSEGRGELIAPSYRKRRGHPILIGRRYWGELLSLPRSGAPRDVINAHQDEITYINVKTDSVLRDVDTPEDYRDERRRAGLDSS